jgi:hypothetical protein
MVELVGEAERRGSARALGYPDTATMLHEMLRISDREAGTRVAQARAQAQHPDTRRPAG